MRYLRAGVTDHGGTMSRTLTDSKSDGSYVANGRPSMSCLLRLQVGESLLNDHRGISTFLELFLSCSHAAK